MIHVRELFNVQYLLEVSMIARHGGWKGGMGRVVGIDYLQNPCKPRSWKVSISALRDSLPQ
jgi:hypothetical protein